MSLLREVGGPFEQASIDEAYLDVTEATGGDWDQAVALCERLQRDVVNATGLTRSEERRGGKECEVVCRSRGSPYL